MDADETEFEFDPSPPCAADAQRPSLARSAGRGAKTGFRLTSYVFGPIAVVMVDLSLCVTTFGAGSGRGWALHPSLPRAFGVYLGAALIGACLGAMIGLIRAFLRRGASGPGWWAAANRPIRLSRKGQGTDAARTRYPSSRLPTWLIIAVVLLGSAVLLLQAAAFGAGMYLGRAVDRRLAEATAAADRDDPHWRLDDLMAHREAVPDAENSALVVAEALALLPRDWPSEPSIPGTPNPPPGEVRKAYERIPQTANIRLDDATAEVLRDELGEHAEAVRIARTVANYDRGRHELELTPDLMGTLLSETQAARTAARLLAADAATRAHDGDLDGALDSCRAILCVGRSIGDEPFVVSQLVRMAIGGDAFKSARRVLGQGEPSDAALARLQALVLDEFSQPLLLGGMRGERAMMDELIRRIGAGKLPISALSGGVSRDELDGRRFAVAPWGKLAFDNQRAVGLEWMTEAVAIARRPAPERPALWRAWEANMDRVQQSRFGKYTATIPLLLTPANAVASKAASKYQSELGALAILLAAERHRRKHGDWPASIAAIDRDILPKAQPDPFSGDAYRYERHDGQLLVYSVGPNRQDEGGELDIKGWMKGQPDDFGTGAWDVPLRRQLPDPE